MPWKLIGRRVDLRSTEPFERGQHVAAAHAVLAVAVAVAVTERIVTPVAALPCQDAGAPCACVRLAQM
ncbi:hypothetical protein PV367_41185 [Streptomyces europaeiscabiei]|uniref:Uncharacterized protein n=1 Tax=Streptomyces europaeiscabiei TaxID=146819 RepID=A0AAJ2PYG2_9ACTN|nr:hypothetical protein [Streptomyces europaeiscabiei]MDX3136069.1 hypothetical protein [Streptomyces europaeiscabiei]